VTAIDDNDEADRLRLEVTFYEEVAGRKAVAARALAGEPEPGSVVVSARTGQAWRIGGLAFTKPELREQGVRALSIAPVGKAEVLTPGEVLVERATP
jgi:hypothetical protein